MGVLLKSREVWPRTSKVYCHRADEWPEDPEIVERVPTRSCVGRGAAIDLVLERGRENRSQFVMTQARGRQVIFWQTSRTSKQARPQVRTPQARAAGVRDLEIVVDSRERYGCSFADRPVSTTRRRLAAGDYGIVRDGTLLAAVERKSLADLVSSLTSGTLKYQLTELASLLRAAIVVEDRCSTIFKLDRVRPSVVADGVAECQVSFHAEHESGAAMLVAELSTPPPLAPRAPAAAEVRAWASAHGYEVSDRGRLPAHLVEAYLARTVG